MKISRALFADALSHAARVAPPRPGIPVAQCVRLEAVDGSLRVAAFDFATFLDLTVECVGNLPPICVNAARLSEVISSALSDTAEVELADERLNIVAGRGRRSLATIPADQFPEPEFKADATLALSADRLRDVIQFTASSAASPDDTTKPGLSGIHFVTKDGTLKAVATDRFNLTLIDVAPTKEQVEFTLGTKAAEMVAQLASGPITALLGERAAVFQWDGGSLRGPLLEDDFVPYEKAIASDFEAEATIEAKALHRALRAVQPLGADDRLSRSKRLKITLNGHGTIATSSYDGEATEEFEADWSGDTELVIGVASSRLEKMLRCFGDAVLTLKFNGPQEPFLIEAAGKPDRLGLLFPMHA